MTPRRTIAAAAGLVVTGSAVLALAASATAVDRALPAGNLVRNPGGEVPLGGATASAPPVLPVAWQNEEAKDKSGQPGKPVQVLRYGTHQSVLPRALSASISGGRNFFNGGYPSGITKAFQVLDVRAAAGDIDERGVKACLSAYLGGGLEGAAGTNAIARVDVAFLGEDDAVRGRLAIGPVTRAHRKDAATLLRRAAEGGVPAGTRALRVALTLSADYPSNHAMADNISVALTKGNCEPLLDVKCVKKALIATVTPSAVAATKRVRFVVKAGKRTKQVIDKRAPFSGRFTMNGLTGRLTVSASVTQTGSGDIALTKKSRRC
jgi:hypothetical protein